MSEMEELQAIVDSHLHHAQVMTDIMNRLEQKVEDGDLSQEIPAEMIEI